MLHLIERRQSWLGIPIFGSDFRDPHWKRNSDSIFDSGDSGQNFFLNSAVEKSTNWNSDSEIRNFEKNQHRNSVLGGPAHLFPPFFFGFGGKHFPFPDGLTASHLTKNWTDEQQTASNFLTPWKLPPPMIAKFCSISSSAG
jgi:hypothetical protein